MHEGAYLLDRGLVDDPYELHPVESLLETLSKGLAEALVLARAIELFD